MKPANIAETPRNSLSWRSMSENIQVSPRFLWKDVSTTDHPHRTEGGDRQGMDSWILNGGRVLALA